MTTMPAEQVGEVRLTMTRELRNGTTVPVTGYAIITPNVRLGTRYRASNVDPIVAERTYLAFDGQGRIRDPENTLNWPKVLASDADGITIDPLQYKLEFELDDVDEQPMPVYFHVPKGSYVNVGLLVDTVAQPGIQTVYVDANAVAGEVNGYVLAAEAAKVAAELARDNLQARAFDGTSATSIAMAANTKTLTTQAGLEFTPGQFVRIAPTAAPGSYMAGVVTSYSGTTLVVAVTESIGSGTYTSWTITISAPRGPQGLAGAVGGFSELAYAESTTQFEVLVGSSTQDVTGLAISFVMPSRPVYLRLGGMARYVGTGTSGTIKVIETTAANASIIDKFLGNSTAATDWVDMESWRRITGPAGVTRSFKAQAVQRATAYSIAGSSSYPQWLGAFSA